MIKRNPGYELRKFAGASYLHPFGQSIADYERGIKLNGTGVLLWEILQVPKNKEDLFCDFIGNFDADEAEKAGIRKDFELFIARMLTQNILIDTGEKEIMSGAETREYEIAGLKMQIKALRECFPKEFSLFQVSGEQDGSEGKTGQMERRGEKSCGEKEGEGVTGSADLSIEVALKTCRFQETGTILVRNEEIVVFEQEDRFLLLFLLSERIVEATLSKDGTEAVVYYMPPSDDVFLEDLFHAIRFFFLYMAQKKGCFALHSVSLIYRDKAWLFSGHSGMGKSTHTGLWQDMLHTPVFNGDLNILSIENGEAVVHGSPWCGTSGVCRTGKYSLGGIVLLKKVEKEVRCHALSEEQKQMQVSNRFISPTWKKELQDKNLDFAKELIHIVPVWKLEHTKSRKSVDVIRGQIDAYMDLDV